MIVTLTRPENSKSAIKLGYPCHIGASSIPAGSKVVRWGNGTEPDSPRWTHVLNKASVMAISTNKLDALQKLRQTVKTPDIYEEGDAVPNGTKIVLRPDNHAEGSDFELVTTGRSYVVPSGRHATRFIEGTREYRVWFVHGNYLVAKRIPRTSEGQTASDPCRSKWGYSFYDECFPKLAEEMGKARLAIPLDFGAADVLWKDGEGWFFLEINSAPSLDHERVLSHFQTHLRAILGPQTVDSVPEPVRRQENAPNRVLATPSGGSWQERYKAQLKAEVEAEKARIREEYLRSI